MMDEKLLIDITHVWLIDWFKLLSFCPPNFPVLLCLLVQSPLNDLPHVPKKKQNIWLEICCMEFTWIYHSLPKKKHSMVGRGFRSETQQRNFAKRPPHSSWWPLRGWRLKVVGKQIQPRRKIARGINRWRKTKKKESCEKIKITSLMRGWWSRSSRITLAHKFYMFESCVLWPLKLSENGTCSNGGARKQVTPTISLVPPMFGGL